MCATQAGGGSGGIGNGVCKYNNNKMEYKLEKIKIKQKLKCREHRLDKSVVYGEQRQNVLDG